MTERGRRDVGRQAESFDLGPSRLYWEGDSLVAEINEIAVPLPRRLSGSVRVTPEACGTEAPIALDRGGRHLWWPLAPCARIAVAFERPQLRWEGHAYLDANFGARPLERDFRYWHWSRAQLRSGTAVLYCGSFPDCAGFERALLFHRGGGCDAFAVPPPASVPGLSLWGIDCETRIEDGAKPRLLQRLEDAPFYTRALIGTRLLGESAPAVHESLSLERFSRGWVRMLLPFRMPRRARI